MPIDSPVLAELWRGGILECVHRGAAVIARPDGEVVASWGDPARTILPRSSCKMIQALPLIESGAADAAGLATRHLALACASHNGAAVHTDLVQEWLGGLGLGESALRCGAHAPYDAGAARALEATGTAPNQCHNNCSGKHSGFVTLNRHLGGGAEYTEIDHKVQRAVQAATEEATDQSIGGYAIDGCSAPNFAVTLGGLATAMARFAQAAAGTGGPGGFTGARAAAASRLVAAMAEHPVLVAGEGRACTALIRAAHGRAVVKTGAEGVFIAIIPGQSLGVALKIDDGGTRGAEAAIAALLVRLGVLDAADPAYLSLAAAPSLNRRGIDCGVFRAAPALLA